MTTMMHLLEAIPVEQAKLDQVSQNYSRDFTVESLKSKGYRVIDERVEQDGTIELVMGE